jgi:2-amino-4-hydroxy-6-hydroxymethyldihydropteridine diphosphokinase
VLPNDTQGAAVIAAVALGSNLGDREAHLRFAFEHLAGLLRPLRRSSLYETTPVGTSGPPFLNAAAVGETQLEAHDLLSALLVLEAERGRERPFRGAPRTLDLDLVLYGDRVVDAPGLVIPHPRFRERRFVLQPLAEIAPRLIDPVTNRSVQQLLELMPTLPPSPTR